MKNIRILSLTLMFILLFSTTSCNKLASGNNEKQENNSNNIQQMAIVDTDASITSETPYFSAKLIDVYEPQMNESCYMSGYTSTEGKIYILLSISDNEKINEFYDEIGDKEWAAEDEEKYMDYFRTELFILDTNGQVQSNMTISEKIPSEMENIQSIRIAKNGDLLLIGREKFDEKFSTSNMMIVKMDPDGNLIDDVKVLTPEPSTSNEAKKYDAITWDKLGNMYVKGNVYPIKGTGLEKGFIEVRDPDGNELFTIEDRLGEMTERWYFESTLLADMDTVYTTIGRDGSSYLVPIDLETQKLGEEVKFDIDIGQLSYSNGIIYSHDERGMYSINLDTHGTETLFYWKDIAAIGDEYNPVVLSDGTIFLAVEKYEEDSSSMYWYILKRESANPDEGKKIIQIGGYEISSDTALLAMALDFNEKNKTCRVELLDYAEMNELKSETDSEKMQIALNMMILSGEIPDILIGDMFSFDYPLYASKGLFADLNQFIEKDQSFHKEDYLDAIFTIPAANENLYYTFTSFSMRGILAKKDTLKGNSGWTLKDLETLIESASKQEEYFIDTSQSDLLEQLLFPSLSNFADVASSEVNFSKDYFKEILEFCKKNGVPNTEIEKNNQNIQSYEWVNPEIKIRNGEIPFTFDYIYDAEGWKESWNLSGADITLTGFPTENESEIICGPGMLVAIAENRENKEIAWELVKLLLSSEQQKKIRFNIPVSREAIDFSIEKEQKLLLDIDISETPELIPLSDEGAEEFRRLVQGEMKVSIENFAIMDIVTEESAAYFASQKSIEDTIQIIHNRITTYMNQL